MIFTVLMNKIKSLIFFVVTLVKYAMCCLRKRRRTNSEQIQLNEISVVVDHEGSSEGLENWTNDWLHDNQPKQPKTIQDHIDLYRKQKSVVAATKQQQEQFNALSDEEQLNFFQDMTPRITRQTKLFVHNDADIQQQNGATNRLSFAGDVANIMPPSELGEWDENHGGWEGETSDWSETHKALKAKRKEERDRKRQERPATRMLGARLSS